MENKKLPLEKDVDLEIEYKLYSIYDFIKKRWKIFLSLSIVLLAMIFGLYFKKQLDIQNREKASKILVEINQALSKNDMEKAKKLIGDFEKDYKDTDLYKVILAYNIIMEKESGKDDLKSSEILLKNIKTEVKSTVKEYIAYINYKNGNVKEAKNSLESIDQKNFNFYSAQSLLGFIYKKEGQIGKAQEKFRLLSNSKYRYFSVIGKENL